MSLPPQNHSSPLTIIWRHRKEKLKKCSLRGLEQRDDICFYTYPRDALPRLKQPIVLAVDAPTLHFSDHAHPLVLVDATWRYAKTMRTTLSQHVQPIFRSLPKEIITAYPRRQQDCEHPDQGLASVEALFIAHLILRLPTTGLLDHYYWKEPFLCKNAEMIANLQDSMLR